MTIEKFKDILINGSDEAKHQAISNAKEELLTVEVFNILFELLKDGEYLNRFFAIYHLIDKFSSSLENTDETRVNDMYTLLFDDFYPVVDRATWALSIIGDKALDKLIKEYYTANDEVKTRIIIAIGRGKFSHRSKDRIQILLDGITSENENLRFNAMSEIMANTQLNFRSEWNTISDTSIDIAKIHQEVLPIAMEFAKSSDNYFSGFAHQYIETIKTQ